MALPGCGREDEEEPQDPEEELEQEEEEEEEQEEELSWSAPSPDWPAALLSVSGTSSEDVWVVGARHQERPGVLHFDGQEWEHFDIPYHLDLWWVHAAESGEVFLGASDGAVLALEDGEFRRFDTLSLARQTVFGVWGDGQDLYAVGGVGVRSGFVWHFDGEIWRSLPLPREVEALPNGAMPGLFKVWGDGEGTVWFVGARGLVLRRDDDGPLQHIEVPTDQTLFTVHGAGDQVIAVGGSARGIVVDLSDEPHVIEIEDAPLLQGISVRPSGEAWAVGGFGSIYHRDEQGSWRAISSGLAGVESLHAVWSDPAGDVWSVGGNVISPRLDQGVIYRGGHEEVANLEAPEDIEDHEEEIQCPEEIIEKGNHGSIARRWVEQNLAAIRLEIPQPGVHARNLYHLSVALFDAWAFFDEEQAELVADMSASEEFADLEFAELAEARNEAMSYAAYTLLSHRYGDWRGGERSLDCFSKVMLDLGYDPNPSEATGASALGVAIGQEVIDAFFHDGALEESRYQDPNYQPPNFPLEVDEPGSGTDDPELWQPLDLAQAVTQNGIALEGGPHSYIGPHWGDVTPFAITRPGPNQSYVESGERPVLGEEMTEWVADVIRRTSWLDTAHPEMMDISPGAFGNNPLGSDADQGHPMNPVTGQPYEPQLVKRADFGRVLAEFWADGPDSETPPGHWNTLAHQILDHPDFERRLFGQEEILDELTFDTHLYLLLNGALHDAAVVAWEQKRTHESSRPITLIRWMGEQGQSTDPQQPSFDPQGLPLIDGLIELITEESSAPGERHEHLAGYVGQLALFSWPGAPGDFENRASPCVWMRAVEWNPYQPRTFVSPAFPGYVSGHSTFSRSAAQVLTALTDSPYFPGGLGEFVAQQDQYLEFENGPSSEIRLQWATYFDAADQSGQSRIWGGIHILPDDYDGREFGAFVGQQTVEWAWENLAILQD